MATTLPFAPTGAPNGNAGLNLGFPFSGTPAASGGIPNMGNLADSYAPLGLSRRRVKPHERETVS
jgi:hypothetical protein